MFNELRKFMTQQNALRSLKLRHPDLIVSDGVIIRGAPRLRLGKRCFFDTRAYLNCADIADHAGWIEMGDNVEIGPFTVLWGQGGIQIGSNVHIGSHVSVTAHEARQISADDIDPMKPLSFDIASVIIESHVLICSGCVITPGVRIGHHAMIGAGAVVVNDIPPYALAVGVPAKPIRYSNIDATLDNVS
jgi:acetyltransferase-like isoleucine patch superfamily enzyme